MTRDVQSRGGARWKWAVALLAIVLAAGVGYVAASRGVGERPRRPLGERPREAPGPRGNIEGRVEDADGDPVAGATVEALLFVGRMAIRPGEAQTDEAGRFRLEGLPLGDYALLVVAPGRARSEWRGRVEGARTRIGRVVLGQAAPVRGRVVDVNGRAPEGVTVVAWPETAADTATEQAGALPHVAMADETGEFTLAALAPGRFRLEVRATGHAPRVRSGVVAPGDLGEIRMEASGALVAKVLDREQRPVEGATVRVAGSGLWPPRAVTSDVDGLAALNDVGSGVYELRATKGALVSEPLLGVEVVAGEPTEVVVVLLAGARMMGRVVDVSTERPIAGARLVLAEDTVAAMPRHATSDAEGRFVFDALLPREHRLSARADGYVPVLAKAVSPGSAVTVELTRGGTVRGRVVDDRGFPVAGAGIEASGTEATGAALLVSATTRALAEAHFVAVTSAPPAVFVPGALVPVGELGVMPGPLPPPPTALGAPFVTGPSPTSSLDLVDPALRTNARGEFVLDGMPPGRLVVSAVHPEFARGSSRPVLLEPGGELSDVEVVLRRGAVLSGRVTDESGFPLPGAEVQVRGADDPAPCVAYSDQDGSFEIGGLGALVEVEITMRDRKPLSVRVDLEPGEVTERTFRLDPPSPAWRARVVDARGFPVGGAMVEARTLERGPRQRAFDVTAEDGSFEMAAIGGRQVQVTVAHPAHATKRVDRMEAADGAQLALDPPAGVRVTVTAEETGGPVPGFSLEVRPTVGPPVRGMGSAEGRTDVTNLPPGRYTLVVTAPGYAEGRDEIDLPPPRGLERITAEASFSLARGAGVRGEVVDGRRDPVPGARVSLGGVGSLARGPAAPPGTTDLRGRFHLGGLPAGDRMLVATHAQLGEARVEVRLHAGHVLEDVRIAFEGRLGEAPVEAPTTSGVGVELEPRRPVVRSVVERSFADEAGISAGDVVVSVDGRRVRTSAEAGAALAGPDGTEVLLVLRRAGEEFAVTVQREPLRR